VCRFCDTDFVGTDGPNGGEFAAADELAQAIAREDLEKFTAGLATASIWAAPFRGVGWMQVPLVPQAVE
jgi:hypothetical protein